MSTLLIIGIIMSVGYAFGEAAIRFQFPRVTGYLLAGIVLNPNVTGFIPANFVDHTTIVTDISLAFITFAVGGVLRYSTIKQLGKTIVSITLLEAELAFACVAGAFVLLAPAFHLVESAVVIPFALLMASLASPTDPSATLAVKEEYNAKGEVIATIMGVAALDDILGIINYSTAFILAGALLNHDNISVGTLVLGPVAIIVKSVGVGVACGLAMHGVQRFFKIDAEGSLIVILFGFLMICTGLARLLQAEELLATMTMGIVVVNCSPLQDRIFALLERYIDQLIFVLFFTISGMHLNFAVFFRYLPLVSVFIIFRFMGKYLGAFLGASWNHASANIKKYVGIGLIPQGGIVIGLALLIKQDPRFTAFADILISLIIGSTVVHEIVGPVIAKTILKKSGEIE